MPVGMARLELYTMFARFLPLADASAREALVQCRFFDIVLDSMERYSRCTLLHAQVARMVAFALGEKSPRDLALGVVVDAGLPVRIAQVVKERLAMPRALMPTLGHWIEMANALVAWEKDGGGLALEGEELKLWRNFTETTLAEKNANANKPLGGQVRVALCRA